MAVVGGYFKDRLWVIQKFWFFFIGKSCGTTWILLLWRWSFMAICYFTANIPPSQSHRPRLWNSAVLNFQPSSICWFTLTYTHIWRIFDKLHGTFCPILHVFGAFFAPCLFQDVLGDHFLSSLFFFFIIFYCTYCASHFWLHNLCLICTAYFKLHLNCIYLATDLLLNICDAHLKRNIFLSK